MIALTRHDQRLLAGAVAFATATMKIGSASLEFVQLLEKANPDSAKGVAMAIALLSMVEPDLDITTDNEVMDWESKEGQQLAQDRFKNNMRRLMELGKKLLDEDAEEFGLKHDNDDISTEGGLSL